MSVRDGSYLPGDDPPYPPMSVRDGLIAENAMISGRPARTALISRGDDPPYPPMSVRDGLIARKRDLIRPSRTDGRGPVYTKGDCGNSRSTVSPPPGVSASLIVPPLLVTSRCTMARPRPVPFWLPVV
jgi:hypothetical protein